MDEGALHWGSDLTQYQIRAALDQPAKVQNDGPIKAHKLLAVPELKQPQSLDIRPMLPMDQVVRYLHARRYEIFRIGDLFRDIEFEQ